MSQLPPLPDDIAALLGSEREIPDPSDEARDRIRSRVMVSIGIAAPIAVSEIALQHGASAAAQPSVAPTATSSSALTKSRVARWATGKNVALAIALGGALGGGAWLTHRVTAPAANHVSPAVSNDVVSAPAKPIGSAVSAPVVAAPEVASPSVAPVAVTPSPAILHHAAAHLHPLAARALQGCQLEHERALLDEARGALTDGNATSAMTIIEQHRRNCPDGQLAEESDSLRVRALALLGRTSEAESAAAEFRRHFPGSIFQPSVIPANPTNH